VSSQPWREHGELTAGSYSRVNRFRGLSLLVKRKLWRNMDGAGLITWLQVNRECGCLISEYISLAELATGRNVFMHIYAFLSREVQRHQILGNERFQSFVKETLTILYWTPRCLLFKSHHCTPLPEFPRLSALNYQFGWINILSVH
jgi:hypothetical protein